MLFSFYILSQLFWNWGLHVDVKCRKVDADGADGAEDAVLNSAYKDSLHVLIYTKPINKNQYTVSVHVYMWIDNIV